MCWLVTLPATAVVHNADPVVVAYRCLATAGTDTSGEPTREGMCGRCRLVGPVHAYRDVVSENFTGWDPLDPTADGLCPPCAWAFTDPRLRTTALLIHANGSALFASREQVTAALRFSFGPDVTVTVPQAGKKHLLPYAEWGTVTSDDGPLTWRTTEAGLVDALLDLRALGVRDADFTDLVPPYRVVAELAADPDALMHLLDRWEALRPWQRSPHLKVAIRGTRPAQPETAETVTTHDTDDAAVTGPAHREGT